MRFLFVGWLDRLYAWQPPGESIRGVCQQCESSRLRTMGVLEVIPHDLLHGFLAELDAQLSALPGDRVRAEELAYAEVDAILPEVAEVWEQHAAPRLRAWIDEHVADLGIELLTDTVPAPLERTD